MKIQRMVDLMNKEKISIWGREFEIEIVYDCYEGELVLPAQEEALKRILENIEVINNAKAELEAYCLKENSPEIGSEKIDNIFRYVIPKALFIQRPVDDKRIVGLMCEYKFDEENGIAIVFKNEVLNEIGSQNIIL